MRRRYRRHGRLYDLTGDATPAGIQNIDAVDALARGLDPALIGAARPALTMEPDPWAGTYTTNPARLEAAQIGGSQAVPSSGGLVTATPDIPSPPEQLAALVNADTNPVAAQAVATAAELTADPGIDIRQAPATNRGVPITADDTVPTAPDPIAQEQGRRQQNKRQQAAAQIAGTVDEDSLPFLAADLGIGSWIKQASANAAAGMHPTGAAGHTAKAALLGGGKLLGAGVQALPWVAAAAPAVMGAMEGAQSGGGGAVIQGGGAGIGSIIGGALGAGAGPLGIAVGAGIGGMIGNAVGGMGRQAAVSAVEAAQGGDTGMAGQIGRSLDGVIDTPMELESRQMVAQMNSPAVLALKEEERRRSAAQRAQAAQDLLMQAYARGMG
jgi:hypothetical protein